MVCLFLQEEFRILSEKDRALKQRENELIAARINWDKTIEAEVERKVHSFHQVGPVLFSWLRKNSRPGPGAAFPCRTARPDGLIQHCVLTFQVQLAFDGEANPTIPTPQFVPR